MVCQNTLRTYEVKNRSCFKQIRFVTALDVIKCSKRIRKPKLLRSCAPISELSFNIRSMNIRIIVDISKCLNVIKMSLILGLRIQKGISS